MPTLANVCAIILNWNRAHDTCACLTSLLPIVRRRELVLIVCDNASCDDSVDRLLEWAEQHFALGEDLGEWDFLLVQTGDNLGYAGGNNVGIRYALERGFEFLWILNNDTVVADDALEALRTCAQRAPQIGIFGSTVAEYYRPHRVQMAGGCRYDPWTTIMRPIYAGKDVQTVLLASERVPLAYVSGAAMFCRAEVFRRVGLLDERFFLYYEELDLAQRLRRAGFELGWCPKSLVYHKGGASTGGRSWVNRRDSWQSHYHENLSTLLYTRKHHPWLLPIAAGLRLGGKALVYLARSRLDLVSALLRAYWDAAFGRLIPRQVQPRVLASGVLR